MERLFTRVDERLIHLQITRKWLGCQRFQRLVIADDEIFEDFLTAGILKLSAPEGLETEILTVAEAADLLQQNEEEIFLLVKRLDTVLRLIESGVAIRQINIGQIPAGKGRRRFASIFLSPAEKESLRQLLSLGVSAVIQMVPAEAPVLVTEAMLAGEGEEG